VGLKGNKIMDNKLYNLVDKIETLTIEAIGECNYTPADLKIRKRLKKIKELANNCLTNSYERK